MALQKLTDAVDTVEFSPRAGYVEPGVTDIVRHRSRSGRLFSYSFFSGKARNEIPVLMTVVADAEQINTWFKNNTELTHYYDLVHSPTGTRTVHIVNSDEPLQMAGQWKTRYEGVIILEEI